MSSIIISAIISMLIFMPIGIIVGYNCRKYEYKDMPDYRYCSNCQYRKQSHKLMNGTNIHKIYKHKVTYKDNKEKIRNLSNPFKLDDDKKSEYFKLIEKAGKIMSDPKKPDMTIPDIVNIELSDIITEENGLSFEVLSEDVDDKNDENNK